MSNSKIRKIVKSEDHKCPIVYIGDIAMKHSGDVRERFPKENIVVIDTETTGLDAEKDEVLSLAIVDIDGNVLFDHLIKPQHHKRWPNAEKINGISWQDVKDEKTLEEYADELAPYFRDENLIVGYNVWFDIEMLRTSGLHCSAGNTFDVMKEYANTYSSNGRYIKLSSAADRYKYKFKAHGAAEDAKATAYVFNCLLDSPKYKASGSRVH